MLPRVLQGHRIQEGKKIASDAGEIPSWIISSNSRLDFLILVGLSAPPKGASQRNERVNITNVFDTLMARSWRQE